MQIKVDMNGAKAAATGTLSSPMQIAYGITSPKIKTTVVDKIIANVAGIIASKKIGKLSMAKALDNNKVANNKCFLSMIGKIQWAFSLSSSDPFNKRISNCSGSIEE